MAGDATVAAAKAKTKKGKHHDDASSRKRRPAAARDDDDDLLDLEVGVNRALASMDSQLLADHQSQQTSRFGSDLSPI